MDDTFTKDTFFTELTQRMDKAIHALQKEFEKLRTGRAHSNLVENIKVDYNATPTPIMHLATITVQDTRTLLVKPWDKSSLTAIEKAIVNANLGITPTNTGDLLRIVIPVPTEERRKELVKSAKKMAEDAKIAIRNIRRDANDILKKKEKEKTLSEDESRHIQEEVQKNTDKFIANIETILAEKEKDILEV